MDYDGFEENFSRRQAALALAAAIQETINNGADPYDGWLPDDKEIDEIRDQWLPHHAFVCQYKKGEDPCNLEAHACNRRCSATYWREHSEKVADMMVSIGSLLNQPLRLWKTAGLLHDLDYVKYPHHDERVSSEKSHPMGVCNFLSDRGAPPVLILGILSHAPHLCFRPESALGWALLACDEHSTMKGFNIEPAYKESVDKRLIRCLVPASQLLTGFHRNDMEGRANLSLIELTKILEGHSPALQLSSSREDVYDWDAHIERI